MNRARIIERMVEAMVAAMEVPGTAPAVILRLARQAERLLGELQHDPKQQEKSSRMSELARRRHAKTMRSACADPAPEHAQSMRSACGNDAANDAQTMREPMRSSCVDACAAPAPAPFVSGTSTSASVQEEEVQANVGKEVKNNRARDGAGETCENDAVNDAPEHAQRDAETDAQNPARGDASSRAKLQRPSDVLPQVWDDWVRHRRAKRAPATQTALDVIRREAGKAGMTCEAAMALSIARGWQGFDAAWVAPGSTIGGGAGRGGHVPKSQPAGSWAAPGEDPVQSL